MSSFVEVKHQCIDDCNVDDITACLDASDLQGTYLTCHEPLDLQESLLV